MATLNVADLNRQGKVFTAANTSAKSVIAVTTAMTGLILYNPPGSGVKAILIDAGFVWTTAPAAVHNIGIALAIPHPTAPSSLTVAGSPAKAADGSDRSGAVIAYDAATLPVAPVARRWFLNGLFQSTTAAGVTLAANTSTERIDGSLILVPGAVACLTVVTTTAVGMGHFTWAEVPV